MFGALADDRLRVAAHAANIKGGRGMKKLMMALVAGLMTMAFAGAYAADEMKKSDTGAMKSEKGMAKKDDKAKAGMKDDKAMKGEAMKGDAMKDGDKAMKGDKAVKGEKAMKGDKAMAKGDKAMAKGDKAKTSDDKMTK